MDYKPASALYLCADDSEEMPSFEDMNLMRNSEFSFNPYPNLQNINHSLQFSTNSDAIKSEQTDSTRKLGDGDNDKPYLYMSDAEDSKPLKAEGHKPSSEQVIDRNNSSNHCDLNILNGLRNSGAPDFEGFNYNVLHSKPFDSRANDYDDKGFVHNYHGEGRLADKSKNQELYDCDTEEEEVKDFKNEIKSMMEQDDKLSEGNDADDDNEEDDETDVERQNDEEEENNSSFVEQHPESEQLETREGSAPTAEGASDEKQKKKKSSKKKADGEETKVRKKRKRKNSGEPSEKKAKTEALRKNSFERKNIRKIFEDENLDEETKAAQKEEMERKQRLLEIQEKLKQQALELRAQREKEMASHPEQFQKREICASSLKSLLEDKGDAADAGNILDPCKVLQVNKPKVTDVVEISSSEDEENEDDDDDLIVMSDVDEGLDDGEEDAENSGSHVNDAMNRPDANGCVLVNVGHPPDEADIFLAPQLASAVKPHQIGGIRFMYDNIVESLERYKTSNGFGCILAHSMGLGKTVQVVSFVDIFLRHTGAKSVLIIVPVNTLQNWINEFNMWLPVVDEGSNMGGGIDKEILWPREFKLYVINDNMKTTNCRTKIVADWYRTGGVLLLGYEMYRLLIKTRGVPVKSRRASKKNNSEPVVIDVEEEEVNKEIIKNLHEALMRPGPDLVICDEGHRIKNSHASISQVLKNIRTRRRVVLTGYPLQNNLLEYWCMVDFVRPNYLGTKQEFCNMFERPIMNGQCADSTPKDVKLMRFRAHVLHSLLEGFVQRRGHAVLQAALPQKEEYVIFVRLSHIQRRLYNEFMSAIKDSGNIASWSNSNNPIKAFSVCCKIWNHPDILYQVVEQRKDDNDLDLDEGKVTNGEVMSGNAPPSTNHKRTYRRNSKATVNVNVQPSNNSVNNAFEGDGKTADDVEGAKEPGTTNVASSTFERKESQVITYEWAVEVMKDYMAGLVEHSGKMVILMDIIDECVCFGDKLLVFSQSLYTLTLIEDYLSRRKVPGTDEYWQKNRNYFRLDGGTAGIDREKLINQFNDYNNNRIHLFLLSTRAGCLGINLIGACRVVIFDASWNPCHDCQAVCRVYRYGQNKCCYVYRLVSDNTMEKNIYDRQINKQGISDRVVDELNPQNLLSKKQVDVLMRSDEIDAPHISLEEYGEKCSDQLLVKVVKKNSNWLTKEPFTHESLLLDRKDQKLTRHEKRLAKQGYEMDKKMSTMGFSRQSSLYGKSIDGSGIIRFGQRPVASVRPMMSAPLKNGPGPRIVANQFRAPGLKPGVSVQQIQTTTDIIIPGTNTVSDSTSSKIPAGEKVLVIKTPKGVYIRTSQGKIFAVRTAPKSGASSSPATSSLSASSTTTTTSSQQGSIASTGKSAEPMEVIDDDEDDDDHLEEENSNPNTKTNDKTSKSTSGGPLENSSEVAKSSKDAGIAGSLSLDALPSSSHDPPVASVQSTPTTSHVAQSASSDAPVASQAVITQAPFGPDRDFPSSSGAKSAGVAPPVKPVLPMQNNRQTKKGRDKMDNNFPGENAPVTKDMSSVAPVNPQPFSKPIAQPQPVTNAAVQPMLQNPIFDWEKKLPFESTPLFGQSSNQSGSGDGAELFPNYLKGNSGSGLHSPFFNRPSTSLASSSSMTLPSSTPTSGKAFNLSDRSNGSSSNKSLMMGSSSSNLHHPVPMAPPSYLPHNPYGMPNPYSWMSGPMWMGASPMDVAHPPPHFPGEAPTYGGSSSAAEDFNLGAVGQGSNDLLGLDGFGGFSGSFDDRSFSSLLMGDEDAQGGSRRVNNNRGVLPNPSYRQNPMGYPHPAPISGYPYHNPYAPYGMPPHQPGGYYGASSNHPSSGGAVVGRGSYIPPSMHYPQHPSTFVQTPYDFGGTSRNLIQGSSTSKKNFDLMKE